MWTLALGGFTASLINTLPVPLLPSLPDLLRSTPANVSWTLTATLLVAAVCTPISGRLGDMCGKRVVLIWCLGLMIGGSVLCALANGVGLLVAGRALQGFGAGALPLGLSIMRDELSGVRLGKAHAAMSSAVGIGGTIGFPLSAFFSQHTDWHVLFVAVALLGLANLLLVLAVVPRSGVRFGGSFDWPGAAGLTVALICLLLVLSKGHGGGWDRNLTLGLLVAGVLVAAWWVRFELRTDQPLVNLRASVSRPVLATNVGTLFIGFAMFGISLILPHVLQAPVAIEYGAGFSMVQTGLCLALAGVVMMVVSPMSAAISARWGASTTLFLGGAIIAVGYAVGIPLIGAWLLFVLAIVVGAGLALAFSAMPALIVANTPRSHTAAANGLNTLTRTIGASASSAVLATILSSNTATVTIGSGEHERFVSAAGIRTALLVAAAAGVLAAVAALYSRDRRS